MNIAQLLGELESAVSEAKVAGERVRKAIEGLKSIFGSLGVESVGVTVIEPTLPLDDGMKYVCPYCLKEFPPYKRRHRDSPRWGPTFHVSRHIGSMRSARSGRHDHGAKNDPIPWVR